MRQTILLVVLLVSMAAHGQEAYTTLRQKARATVENTTNNALVRQISQFKLDALNYMAIKMREEMPDSSATYLDKQAIAMDNFVNFYIEKFIAYSQLPKVEQVKLIKVFMDISYSNPLFNDKDRELVLSYYNMTDCLTRFSLDTDWRKAVAALAIRFKE